MRTCETCGKSIVAKNAQARYCSTKCRVAAHRKAKKQPIPVQLIEADRWMRWKTVYRGPEHKATKMPLDAITGRNASSTNPDTWSSHQEAATSTFGEGVGFALGQGFACIDLDDVIVDGHIVPAAAELIRQYPGHYIEISPSGTGLHIYGTADENKGSRKIENGIHVERYSWGRYVTVTGNKFQAGSLLPM